MKLFFSSLLILISIFSCDQIIRLKNNIDSSIEKDTKSTKKIKNGLLKQYYSDGKIKSAVNFMDGKREGEAKNYYENGNIKLSMVYKNGKKDGKSLFYYENGELYRESNYKNDELDGERLVYAKGKVKSRIVYKNGYPGLGLQEYLVNGKLKTSFPELVISPIDNRLKNGLYHLDIYFSDAHPKDEFYLGELLEGKFVHSGLGRIDAENGHGRFTIPVPPGSYVMRTINIVGVHQTRLGNPYVRTRSYNLSIE